MNRPLDYLVLATAGGVGVLLRAGCHELAMRLAAPGSAWAVPSTTLAVNVAGSFLFGLVSSIAPAPEGIPPAWKTIVLVGLLGGFTTYSTFSFQAFEMIRDGRTAAAVTYVAATNVLAIAAAGLGLWIGVRGVAG